MLKEYKQYCDIPSLSHAKDLLEALTATHIIDNQEFLDLWEHGCRTKHKSVNLTTSGSTGRPKTYPFGPNSEFWLGSLEKLTKWQNKQKPVYIRNRLLSYPNQRSFGVHFEVADPQEPLFSAFLNVSHFDHYNVLCLINILDIIKAECLLANPNVWLYLLADDRFSYYVEKRGLRIISTNWEPFFKKSVLVNDTMINWYNGTNFYTCRFNNKHFFPFFAKKQKETINLLNLNKGHWLHDDLLIENGICECGKTICHFIPHLKSQPRTQGRLLYEPKLAESLTGRYQNLQFIMRDKPYALFVGTITQEDRHLINDHVGAEVVFLEGKSLKIGQKYPVFYRDESCAFETINLSFMP